METELSMFSEYKHAILIWKVIPPILILVGVPGNILTIVVLMQRRSRSSSTALYLTALATADLCVLCTGLLRQWIKYLCDLDIRYLSNFGCEIHIYIVYVGTQCSSWMLVAVTIERFIGAWAPHRVKQGCHSRSAAVVIVVIHLCILLLNSHWYIGLGEASYAMVNVVKNNTAERGERNQTEQHELQQYKNTTEVEVDICAVMYDDYRHFLNFTWPWVDLCVFCLVPFTILIIGNISILIKVLMSRRKTRIRINPTQPSVGQSAATGPPTTTDTVLRVKRRNDKTSQLAFTLLLLNVVFLVCVTPMSIYLIGEPHWYAMAETDHDIAVMRLWWAVVNVFMYLNHTLNFVLYFLSGSRFRAEVKALLFGKPGTNRGIFPTAITRVAPAASPHHSTVAITANTVKNNTAERGERNQTEQHELQQY